jgi:hypothetical protein
VRDRQRQLRGRGAGGPEPPRSGFATDVEQAVDEEMEALSAEGWLGRELVERSLRRVARRAVSSLMYRAGLGGESEGVTGT